MDENGREWTRLDYMARTPKPLPLRPILAHSSPTLLTLLALPPLLLFAPQMQAGTTGINAMRVYNVTKQGRDQDPSGTFIKRYVPELAPVPVKYVHVRQPTVSFGITYPELSSIFQFSDSF